MRCSQGSAWALVLLTTLVNSQAIQPVSNTTASGAPTVDLGYAKYQGVNNGTGINYFRGVQYAANPTGSLRWQKPRPIESLNSFDSNTIYNAVRYPPKSNTVETHSSIADSDSAGLPPVAAEIDIRGPIGRFSGHAARLLRGLLDSRRAGTGSSGVYATARDGSDPWWVCTIPGACDDSNAF